MAEFDLVIHGGTIVDGSGGPRRSDDIGIRGDRVAAIGTLDPSSARAALDATGRIVAPGCVDVHNHSDGWLLRERHLLPKTSQGFTTEVLMADGISYAPVDPETALPWIIYLRSLNGLGVADYDGWRTVADYMGRLDGRTAQNAMAHVPYANVRTLVMGWGREAPDDIQTRLIQAEIRRAMEEGAVGLSTGLDYVAQCFATTDELVDACRAIVPHDGLYVTHVRYKKGVLEGVREAVEIGRRADVRVHVSHLKTESTRGNEELLDFIDRVAINEVDFSFDVYPYLRGSTMLHYLLPYEVWEEGPLEVPARLMETGLRRRFAALLEALEIDLDSIRLAWVASRENSAHLGLTVAEYVALTGKTAADAICDLLIEEHLAVLCVFRGRDDDESSDAIVDAMLQHDRAMLGSDGIYFPDGLVHPRVHGSAPRLLGPLVRDRRLFSLEEAVRKVSGAPAERFGLVDRGVLRIGAFADLVVFDAGTIADNATYTDPHRPATGVDSVLVNGQFVLEGGEPVGAKNETQPGRWLRYRGGSS